MSNAQITGGFWLERLRINKAVSMPAVLDTFERTGRVRMLTGDLRPDETPHIFWESDLAKWLEAAFIEVRQRPDDDLLKLAESIFDKIIANQTDDGYLNAYFTRYEPQGRFTNLRVRHELYCAGHLLEAAVEHFRLQGSSRFLDAMDRYMDMIAGEFGTAPGLRQGYPGHQEIEMALTKAYEATGRAKYLKLAEYFIDERGREPRYFDVEHETRKHRIATLTPEEREGAFAEFVSAHHNNHDQHGKEWNHDHCYTQAHARPVDQETAEGHAVRALYMFSGMADIARLRDDADLLAACKKLWRNIVDRRMYVHGGVGSAHIGERFTVDYDLPNDSAYAETCAGIALIFFAHRLLQIERDSEYADIIERALYNLVLAGGSQDGKGFFYTNYLECDPGFLQLRGMRHGVRDEYHTCSCCPPNVLRLYADLGKYVFQEDQDGLVVHQFISAERTFVRHGQTITLAQDSSFPFEGNSRLHVKGAAGQRFSIFVRIPEWDRGMVVSVNGEAVQWATDGGYAVLDREWHDGDRVELLFNFAPRLAHANPNVRHNVRRVAVFRGPLLYCLESHDNTDRLNSITLPADPTFSEAPVETLHPDAMSLSTKATVLNASGKGLYSTNAPTGQPSTAVLIPYFLWANRGESEMLVWINHAGADLR